MWTTSKKVITVHTRLDRYQTRLEAASLHWLTDSIQIALEWISSTTRIIARHRRSARGNSVSDASNITVICERSSFLKKSSVAPNLFYLTALCSPIWHNYIYIYIFHLPVIRCCSLFSFVFTAVKCEEIITGFLEQITTADQFCLAKFGNSDNLEQYRRVEKRPTRSLQPRNILRVMNQEPANEFSRQIILYWRTFTRRFPSKEPAGRQAGLRWQACFKEFGVSGDR